MTSNNCAIFKVFLKTDSTTEVRKFVVDDASVITSFVFVKEKLQTLFPKLREHYFKITWRDSDGDDIIIDNDEDLILAFTEMDGPNKTLYISIESGNQQPFNPSQFMHGGSRIVCDVCNNEISTYRYKCLQCMDYDLCGACEHAGHHSHHMMLRTSTPDLPFARCGRRIFDNFNKAVKKANHMAYRECKKKSKFDGKKNKHDGCDNPCGEGSSKQKEQQSCPFEEYIPQFYPLIDVISNVASNVASNAAKVATNAAATAAASATANVPAASTASPSQNAPNPQNPENANTNQNNIPSGEEYTNQFVELVRNALSGVFVQTPQTPNQPNKDVPNTQTQTTNAPQSQTTPNAPMESEVDLTGEPMETTPPTREPGWTILGSDESVSQSHYPVLQPTMVAQPEPQDPVIAVGLQQLLDMGFSDKNALIALLKRYNGNVHEVIKHIFENK